LQQLCRREQAKGAQRLLLEVRPSNLPARALYAASGFVEIGRRKHYYPAANGREDALVLALQLPVCDAAVGQAR
jgi:ribosomal-protein-alanine N-acetyltransferase